jgi:L-rhamnose mutarotase
VLAQLPGVGAFIPSIPRPDSTAMLGAFFRMALAMSDGVPTLTVRRQAIAEYYASHADGWLEITKQWSYLKECGDSYFAIHIAYIMAFAWTHLEQDPARRTKLRDEVLDQRGWALVKNHKNPYLAFLWGATRPNQPPEMTAAIAQLAQFPVGPRVNVPMDHRATYPNDASCKSNGENQAAKNVAVDVKDRAPQDFMWQRHPWSLFNPGNAKEVFPGVDYAVAYWAGRRFGFIDEDRTATCARWIP